MIYFISFQRRTGYKVPSINVYKPVGYRGGLVGGHNSIHRPLIGDGYNFGSRLPIAPYGSQYVKQYAGGKNFKNRKPGIKLGKKTITKKVISNSHTNVHINKEQPMTVVFNRPKPIIVLDRRPIINVFKKMDNSKIVDKNKNLNLIGTLGRATEQKTILVDSNRGKSVSTVEGAKVKFKGGNAVGGGARVKAKTGDMTVNIHNKQPAGFFQHPGMVEAAMAAASAGGMGKAVDVGRQFDRGGQNVDISSLMGGGGVGIGNIGMPGFGVGGPSAGISMADALALSSAVARLEQKISGMQQNVNINNNNNNNNNNLNNNLNHNFNEGNGGFDIDPMMMAMMMTGDFGDAMMDAMAQKAVGAGSTGGGGTGGGGSGSGSGGGGSGGGVRTIKLNPEKKTGKSVILKVDGNVQISKSNIAK